MLARMKNESSPCMLVSREFKQKNTCIKVGNISWSKVTLRLFSANGASELLPHTAETRWTFPLSLRLKKLKES